MVRWKFETCSLLSYLVVNIVPSRQTFKLCLKLSLIKVVWSVLRVKNMHSWSPLDPSDPWGEEKWGYVHYIIREGEAKPCISKLTSMFHQHPSVGSKQLCVCTVRMYPQIGYFLVNLYWHQEKKLVCKQCC